MEKLHTESQPPLTPKRRRRIEGMIQPLMQTPKSSSVSQVEERQTPRRSARKSIKPAQDYEDIVANKSLRSLKKDEKHSSHDEEEEVEEKDVHKWTPAKVGRVSEKRKSRKGRRNLSAKKNDQINVDEDVLEVIANDEDENKENVEPQEQLRNRKSPKDSEAKAKTSRRSNEILGLKPEQIRELNTSQSALHQPPVQKEEEDNVQNIKASKIQTENLELSELGLVAIVAEDSVAVSQSENVKEPQLNRNLNILSSEEGGRGVTILETSTCIIISPILESDIQSEEQVCQVEDNIETEHSDLRSLVEAPKVQAEVQTLSSEVVIDEHRNSTSTDDKDVEAAQLRVETSDCMIISPELKSDTDREPEEPEVTNYNMPSLLISDDEDNEQEEQKTLESENCDDTLQPETYRAPMESEVTNYNMPSLLISDDEDNEQEEQKTLESDNSDDNLQPAMYREPIESEVTNYNMPSLLISDDEDNEQVEKKNMESESCDDDLPPTATKVPKIMINNKAPVFPITPKRDHKKVVLVTSQVTTPATPKSKKPKPYRFPTPYKLTEAKQLPQPREENATKVVGNDTLQTKLPTKLNLTTLEPNEIVLRSIRKRSFSACTERTVKKQLNRVKFHSPANQTVLIDELDLLIGKSAKKAVNSKASEANNVTQRRKRSMSMDESMMQPKFKLKLGPLTPSKDKATPQKVQHRLKIPNFAAIHQRQFNKMENVVEHVVRKAERAKDLINSSSKIRSAQKIGFTSNNQNIGPSGGGVGTAGIKNLRLGKPKALKAIDLSDNGMNSAAPLEITKVLPDNDNAEEAGKKSTICNLPNPYLFKNLAIVKPMMVGKKLQAAAAATKKVFKPTQQQPQQQQQHHHYGNKPKPPFNLSTHIARNENCALLERAEAQAAAAVNTTITTSTAVAQSTDKVSSRRQRHMDMFKGRGASGRGASNKDKSSEIIRGVRSNRRFDLQMLHRKNLAHDHI